MQRRWVPISLWPNMGNRRFCLSVVTNAATEPSSSDRIYRDTGSVLTEWKLVNRCFQVATVWLSNKVLTFLCLHCSSLSQESYAGTHPTPDTITHTAYMPWTKKYVQEKCRDTIMLLQVRLLFGWRAITGKPWPISAGRFSPQQDVETHMCPLVMVTMMKKRRRRRKSPAWMFTLVYGSFMT